MLRHVIVEVAGRIFAAPGVVAPIDNRHFVIVADEDRAVIAAPGFIRRKRMEMDARIDRGVRFLQRGADAGFLPGEKTLNVDLLASASNWARAAQVAGIVSNASGKLMPSGRGQVSQVASCRAHSAGIRKPSARGVAVVSAGVALIRYRF